MTPEAQEVQYYMIACAINGALSLIVLVAALIVAGAAARHRFKGWEEVMWVAVVVAGFSAIVTWRQALGVINAYVAPQMIVDKKHTIL